jgi:hypothetical protein
VVFSEFESFVYASSDKENTNKKKDPKLKIMTWTNFFLSFDYRMSPGIKITCLNARLACGGICDIRECEFLL